MYSTVYGNLSSIWHARKEGHFVLCHLKTQTPGSREENKGPRERKKRVCVSDHTPSNIQRVNRKIHIQGPEDGRAVLVPGANPIPLLVLSQQRAKPALRRMKSAEA
jgi:hypothetical protein